MLDTNERPPGLDERYISATNASNLTLDADRIGPVDHLIAAGLVGNRMGSILIHLVGEWTSADKPPKWSEDEILARAAELPKRKGKVDVKRARAEAIVAHASAMRAAYQRLPSRAAALSIMEEWARMRDVDGDLLSPALYHHLNPTCPVCDGLGQLRMADAPVLGKQCHHCNGAGTWPRPLGAERVHQWLKGCAGKARSQRGGMVHGNAEVTPMADRLRGLVLPDDEPDEVSRVAEFFQASMKWGRR